MMPVLAAVLLFSCGKKAEVIPPAKMARIYADMFLVDQWIVTKNLLRQTDTMQVYEPVLRKYGYTVADYRKSLDVYMGDPERMHRIVGKSKSLLEKRVKELEIAEREAERRDTLSRDAGAAPRQKVDTLSHPKRSHGKNRGKVRIHS